MIELRIARDEFARGSYRDLSGPRATEAYMLDRMRSAGIPVSGVTFFTALAKGRLTIRRDFDGGYTFYWQDS